MTRPLFTGVGVALVTLFDERADVDVDATATLAAELATAGVRAVVIAGSTGEAASLDGDERAALTKAVRDAVPADVPVVVGTGAPSARQACRLSAEVLAAGADAVLALSPPGVAAPIAYYDEVVRSVDGAVPVMAYHYPKMSSPGVDVELLPRLAELGVAGIKDSSGDSSRLVRTLDVFDGWLHVGSPWVLSAAGPLGATGAILAVANVEPALSIAAFAGDPAAQRALAPAAAASGPAAVKALLGRSTVTRIG